jgi:Ca2+-transporting ATPase
MQIFNEFNNRRLDNKFNIFENIHKNLWFIGINCIMVGGQIMIVFVGGKAFQITRIDGPQWAVSILCALPCLLWAILVRLFPDSIFEVIFNACYGAITFVVRPIWKVLHIVFHPVAQVFRAMSRTTKRMFKKKGDDSEDETDEKQKVDEESGVPSMPTMMGSNKPEYELKESNSSVPSERTEVPEFKVTEPTS